MGIFVGNCVVCEVKVGMWVGEWVCCTNTWALIGTCSGAKGVGVHSRWLVGWIGGLVGGACVVEPENEWLGILCNEISYSSN